MKLSVICTVLLVVGLTGGEDCSDLEPSCSQITSYCDIIDWVKERCPLSCGVCLGEVSGRSLAFGPPIPAGWSQCSKTCGMGTRHKTTNGEMEYEACSPGPCLQAACIGKVRRNGIPHACCSNQQSSCGVPEVGGLIVGGSDTAIKNYPWMAMIMSNYILNPKFCSAAIISTQWLISAGQCFKNSETKVDYEYSAWKVYVGTTSSYDAYRSTNIPQENIKEIDSVIFHPDHDFPKADIVLIKLKTALTYSEIVKPICLPGGEVTPRDTKCFVSGWGFSDLKAPVLTDTLQVAEIYNFDMDVCKAAYRGKEHANFVSTETRLLCAGNLHALTNACKGDTGGALVCQRCTSCTYYMAGMVSFGNKYCNDKNIPGIYTRIRDYENWIGNETGVSASGESCNGVGP